jgi:3-methyladenine DNA glycosylase Tag
MEQIHRCEWAGPDQIYIDYHDNEWGKPLHDDNRLFEMLILEGRVGVDHGAEKAGNLSCRL